MPHTFVPHTNRGSTENLALICKAVLEMNMFEFCDLRRMDEGRTDAGVWIYFKLTNEPSAQVS